MWKQWWWSDSHKSNCNKKNFPLKYAGKSLEKCDPKTFFIETIPIVFFCDPYMWKYGLRLYWSPTELYSASVNAVQYLYGGTFDRVIYIVALNCMLWHRVGVLLTCIGRSKSSWLQMSWLQNWHQAISNHIDNSTVIQCTWTILRTLRWRHNGRDSVSNLQPHDCLLNRLFRRRSKKTSMLRVIGLCVGNSPGTGEFPAQMASNAENVSIWWRHHATCIE